MKGKTIAVIMNFPNRWGKFLVSLAALLSQELSLQVKLGVYLDDSSTVKSAEGVQPDYPEIKILPVNGGLFRNGGMRCALINCGKNLGWLTECRSRRSLLDCLES